jgi:cell division protein FtsB
VRRLTEVPAAWRRWTTRVVLAALVAGVIAIGGWWLAGRSSADRADAMRAQLRSIDDESRRLAADNARMARDVEALKNDPAAIEDIARAELGLVYPGELVLKLAPAAPPSGAQP